MIINKYGKQNLVQSTVGIEVCVSKRLEEAHVVRVGVDDVDVVGVLRLDHQLGVVAETLGENASSLALQ